jgi:hypothetical protein
MKIVATDSQLSTLRDMASAPGRLCKATKCQYVLIAIALFAPAACLGACAQFFDIEEKSLVTRTDVLDTSLSCATLDQKEFPYIFCADFDHVPDAAEGWSYSHFTADGGSFELDTTNFKTRPAAAVVISPSSGSPPTGGLEPDYQIGYQSAGPYSAATLAFDLRIDLPSLDQPATFAIASLGIGPDLDTVMVAIVLDPGKNAHVDIAGQAVQLAPEELPEPMKWLRVRISLDGKQGSVYFDGKRVASAPMPAKSGPLTAAVGVIYTFGDQSTLRAQYDDVVVTSP